MPKDLWDHLKAGISKRFTGSENMASGGCGFASMVNAPPPPYPNRLLAPGAPHAIIPAGDHYLTDESLFGMEHIENGNSDQFAAWIDGKGQFVPQPLPADSVPQAVVTSDWLHGLTHEMLMGEEAVGANPSPIIAPINFLRVPYNNFPTQCHETSGFPIVDQSRFEDTLNFQSFFIDRSSTNGCNNSMEKGTCIWSDGTLPWSDKSCGITWVAVHGMNSTCVVTRHEDLEQEVTPRVRSAHRTKEDLLHMFRQGIIYKVEDLVDQMFKSRQMSDQSLKKPFGVVSVTHKGSGNEASSAEYGEEKAIKFLQDEMKSNTAFTVNKTVQTAIFALEHLFHKKFKANEIRVIVRKENDDLVKELRRRDDRSIEEQIAVIRARQRRLPR